MVTVTFIRFMCLDRGMTPVDILGTLTKDMVTFDTKGISGAVRILNRILPDNRVNSALTSIGALSPVLKRMAMPGGAEETLRLLDNDATGCA